MTVVGADHAQDNVDHSIRSYDFANVRWYLPIQASHSGSEQPRATPNFVHQLLRDGQIGIANSRNGLHHFYLTGSEASGAVKAPPVFADLNGDGFEDAIVSLTDGTQAFPYVWLGGVDGPRQLNALPLAGSINDAESTQTIRVEDGLITVTGERSRSGCARDITQYTRVLKVQGSSVSLLRGPAIEVKTLH